MTATGAATGAATRRSNPYIGPRAFRAGETIYGRERELARLAALLIAERVVLLHSPSGAGKSSLIQAALIPRLAKPTAEGGENFRVLPLARVQHEPPDMDRLPSGFNRYVYSTIACMEAQRTGWNRIAPIPSASSCCTSARSHLGSSPDVLSRILARRGGRTAPLSKRSSCPRGVGTIIAG